MIDFAGFEKGTIVTILNYDSYQFSGDENKDSIDSENGVFDEILAAHPTAHPTAHLKPSAGAACEGYAAHPTAHPTAQEEQEYINNNIYISRSNDLDILGLASKNQSASDENSLADVASLGCVACRNAGYGASPAEVHHIRATAGMGQRASHQETIPLCPPRHRGTANPIVPSIHLQRKRFEREFGTELELLAQTVREVEWLRENRIGGHW